MPTNVRDTTDSPYMQVVKVAMYLPVSADDHIYKANRDLSQ